jgi:tetratricopeptide (TPR) repeat protein
VHSINRTFKWWIAVAVTGVVMATPTAAVAQGYQEPGCDLPSGHFLVNSGKVYIKGASEEGDPVKRERLLGDARRNLENALDRGQEDNPTVWYYLGRYYVMTSDPIGADSVFTRAEELAPECAEDIAGYRQRLWVPAINGAIQKLREGNLAEARPLLQQAWAIYPSDNRAPYFLAQLFYNERAVDSAVHYFNEVVDLGRGDSTVSDNYDMSVINLALLYTQTQESAVVWFDKYRAEVDPNDAQALTGLARAAAATGDSARALLLYDSILVRAPDMAALDLFKTGESLFLAGQYQRAVTAFTLGLEKNPYYRPGLYNLVNSHLAVYNELDESLEDGPDSTVAGKQDSTVAAMEDAALRLVAVDPNSADAMRLLAASYQLQQKDDSTLALLERIEALTFDVVIDVMQPFDGAFTVQGRLTNRSEEAEVEVPEIEWEFLDEAGNVLSTQIMPGKTLAAGATEPFSVEETTEGVVAARYTVPE